MAAERKIVRDSNSFKTIGERVFNLEPAHIQTLTYLKLSVAGHLMILLTRTRGPFWSIGPARIANYNHEQYIGRRQVFAGF
jgi:hypothetical protein